MIVHRQLTVRDYALMVRRRLKIVVISVVLVTVAAVIASRTLPARYVSQTLILVEQQHIPESYVRPVVDEDLGARLASMREEILSRSRLEPLIIKYGLGSGNTMDERVAETRNAIKITPIRSSTARTGGIPGFYVSFEAGDPHTAQMVCTEITTLFVNENLKARENTAEGTTTFLRQQLDDAKRALDTQDAALAAFQRRYLGNLPEQMGSNTSTLQSLSTELEDASETVSRTQEQINFLEAIIAQPPAAGTPSTMEAQIALGSQTEDPRQEELQSLLAKQKTMAAIFTPDYPDMVALKQRIKDIESQIQASPAPPASAVKAPAAPSGSPRLAQMNSRLRALKQSLAIAEQEKNHLEQQVNDYQKRVERTPEIAEQYKQISTDHENALEFYNSLLAKMKDSDMATALEQRQQGEQFRVLDAADLPDTPSFPNRRSFLLGGIGGGFFLGVAISVILEFRDKTVRTDKDVWAFAHLPTLATMPVFTGVPKSGSGWWKKKKRT